RSADLRSSPGLVTSKGIAASPTIVAGTAARASRGTATISTRTPTICASSFGPSTSTPRSTSAIRRAAARSRATSAGTARSGRQGRPDRRDPAARSPAPGQRPRAGGELVDDLGRRDDTANRSHRLAGVERHRRDRPGSRAGRAGDGEPGKRLTGAGDLQLADDLAG